jgi:hypothetical protein
MIARIPQTIPAAAPITIKLGVKCAATVPPEPANMACPNWATRYLPSRKPLGVRDHLDIHERPLPMEGFASVQRSTVVQK